MLKRSFLCLVAACAVALASAASWAGDVVSVVATRARSAWDFVTDVFAKIVTGPAVVRQAGEVKPRAQLLAAQQFFARLVKRERPVVMAGDWRMCPSV